MINTQSSTSAKMIKGFWTRSKFPIWAKRRSERLKRQDPSFIREFCVFSLGHPTLLWRNTRQELRRRHAVWDNYQNSINKLYDRQKDNVCRSAFHLKGHHRHWLLSINKVPMNDQRGAIDQSMSLHNGSALTKVTTMFWHHQQSVQGLA